MIMNKPFPLSFTQQDIYFDQLLCHGSPLYNIGGFINLADVNEHKLAKAHARLVKEHDVFGIRIVQYENTIAQYISSDRNESLPLIDLSVVVDPQYSFAQWSKALFQNPMEFYDQPLYRSFLIKLAPTHYCYVGIAHHLMIDGFGFSNWASWLGKYYHASASDQPKLKWQSIAEKDQLYLQSKRYQKDESYWQQQLDTLPDSHWSPVSAAQYAPNKSVPSHRTELTVSVNNHLELIGIAQQHDVSVAQVYMAILMIYYGKLTQKSNISVGVPAHNRSGHDEKSMIGVFTSISPVQVNIDHNESLYELCKKSKLAVKRNFKHQRYPLGNMKRYLRNQGKERNQLYDIEFNYLKLDSDITINNHVAELEYLSHNHEQTPLIMTVWEYGQDASVRLQLDHNLAYISKYDGQLLAARLEFLIEQLIDNPGDTLGAFQIIPPQEHQLLTELNDTAMDYPKDKCIHELFEEQAKINRNNVALIFGGTSDGTQLTYKALNEEANQLAHYLVNEHNVKPDTLVGLCVERSLDMVIGILGILKAGGAYVPLDPSYPQRRLNYMLEDSGLEVVLTQTGVQHVLGGFSGEVIALDSMVLDVVNLDNLSASQTGLTASNLAYVIYTSGSTGLPKGVLIEQQSVTNLIYSQMRTYRFEDVADAPEVGLMLASYAFDASVEQMFIMLLTGNTLVMPCAQDLLSPEALLKVISAHQITHIDSTPSHLMGIVECLNYQSVKRVISGGEAMLLQLIDVIEPGTELYNVYGPTESCVTSSVQILNDNTMGKGAVSSGSIGKPVANTTFYIVDDNLNLVPKGASGELCIGGDGLARGYLNRTELTKTCFIDNPFYQLGKANSSSRLYKTGDLVRYLPDGDLEFIGRVDDQVKIRGFRIELGEVESQLSAQEGVDSALVMAKALAGSEQLVGYIKLQSAHDEQAQVTLVAQVKAELSAQLPSYMVPSVLMVVNEWPLTPNGKVDRKALPAPDGSKLQGEHVAPGTETEKALVDIWSEILNIDADKISTTANFFELGGHSLLLTRLGFLVSKKFSLKLDMSDLYSISNLQMMARAIKEAIEIEQKNTKATKTIVLEL